MHTVHGRGRAQIAKAEIPIVKIRGLRRKAAPEIIPELLAAVELLCDAVLYLTHGVLKLGKRSLDSHHLTVRGHNLAQSLGAAILMLKLLILLPELPAAANTRLAELLEPLLQIAETIPAVLLLQLPHLSLESQQLIELAAFRQWRERLAEQTAGLASAVNLLLPALYLLAQLIGAREPALSLHLFSGTLKSLVTLKAVLISRQVAVRRHILPLKLTALCIIRISRLARLVSEHTAAAGIISLTPELVKGSPATLGKTLRTPYSCRRRHTLRKVITLLLPRLILDIRHTLVNLPHLHHTLNPLAAWREHITVHLRHLGMPQLIIPLEAVHLAPIRESITLGKLLTLGKLTPFRRRSLLPRHTVSHKSRRRHRRSKSRVNRSRAVPSL